MITDTRLERWKEQSPDCISYLSNQKSNFETLHLAGLITAIASVATLIFLNGATVLSAGFIFQVTIVPVGIIFGFGMVLSSLFDRHHLDWNDYTNVDTVKQVKKFWSQKSLLEDFSNEAIKSSRAWKVGRPLMMSLNSYGLVSTEKVQRVFDIAREYYYLENDKNKNEEKMAKKQLLELEWPKAYQEFIEDFPDFENLENTKQTQARNFYPQFFLEKIVGQIDLSKRQAYKDIYKAPLF